MDPLRPTAYDDPPALPSLAEVHRTVGIPTGASFWRKLLFHIPLFVGVCLTALDVLAILYLQHKRFRYLEAVVVTLIATIGLCYLAEILWVRPDFLGIARGFLPTPEVLTNRDMLYIT